MSNNLLALVMSKFLRLRNIAPLSLLLCVGITWVVFTYGSTADNVPRVSFITNINTNDHMLIPQRPIVPDLRTLPPAVLPKVIYMLWDKGWANAPKLQILCLKSFLRHNADFSIKAMNLTEAEELISRADYYTDRAWNNASIQSKSDIIRVELLAKYGGIWADASVYCNEPILNWLNISLFHTKFLAFERKDSVVNEQNSPWIASWFLVATTNSDMIQTWRDRIRQAWTEDRLPPQTLGYNWVHRLFLVISNSTFRAMFHSMPFLDAGLPHCWGPKDVLPRVYKLKAKSCDKVRSDIFARETMA